MIYFIVLFLLLILTVRYDINGKTEYRDQWYNGVLVILILIAGLRFRLGEDTLNYMDMFFFDTPSIFDFDVDTFLSSDQPPLWILLNSIVKTFGGKFFVVQIIQATILNTLMLKYFKKHSSYPYACVVFYFIWRYQWFSMVVMKAAIALSILLYANDFFLEKKYLKGLLLVLIATGFHQSSILLIITPLLLFLRLNIWGITFIFISFFVGAFVQSQLGEVFVLFEAAEGVSGKLDDYLNSDYMTQNHNLNYFILNIFPLIIYPVLSLFYLKKYCKESSVLKFEPIILIALMFQVMQFSIDVMYRYIYTLSPYYIIIIVHFFMDFSKNSLRLKKSLAFTRTLIILFPLLVSIAYLWRPFTHPGFNPYSSVIERSFDEDREKYYGTRTHYGNRYQKNPEYY